MRSDGEDERLNHECPELSIVDRYVGDAVVPSVVKNEVIKFPTGCPKACALIGDLNETLRDRCLVVKMRRGR